MQIIDVNNLETIKFRIKKKEVVDGKMIHEKHILCRFQDEKLHITGSDLLTIDLVHGNIIQATVKRIDE